jgi:GT2 family glycosyltransferase
MDESLPVACNDLDLCLRVGALGLRNVMTPFAQLYHTESASRGYHYDSRHALQETRDEARFRLLHGERLRHDCFYNPNLTLRGAAYALAWSAEDRSVLQHPSSAPGDALGR